MRHLNDDEVIAGFERLVKQEKHITAELVAHLREIEARKLCVRLGYRNTFEYLTKGLGYPPASAQRRIEAARLMAAVPAVKKDLESGTLNLTQISILAQGFRKKGEIALEEKTSLVEKVRSKEAMATEIIVARELNLPVAKIERAKYQADESVRFSLTFAKEEMATLQRLRAVISHRHPNLSWSEFFLLLVQEALKKRNPLTHRNFRSEVTSHQKLRHTIFQRDRSCQWRNQMTGQICGSRFQLQIHHVRPRSKGGRDEPENLQLLCSAHHQQTHR